MLKPLLKHCSLVAIFVTLAVPVTLRTFSQMRSDVLGWWEPQGGSYFISSLILASNLGAAKCFALCEATELSMLIVKMCFNANSIEFVFQLLCLSPVLRCHPMSLMYQINMMLNMQ